MSKFVYPLHGIGLKLNYHDVKIIHIIFYDDPRVMALNGFGISAKTGRRMFCLLKQPMPSLKFLSTTNLFQIG